MYFPACLYPSDGNFRQFKRQTQKVKSRIKPTLGISQRPNLEKLSLYIEICWKLTTIAVKILCYAWRFAFVCYICCSDEPPWHRQFDNTLSLLRGTSISSQCLQSGHKTATTLWMCAEFLLSFSPKRPHPSLYSSLLATSLTQTHIPHCHTHLQWSFTCQNKMCRLPLEVLSNLFTVWQKWC